MSSTASRINRNTLPSAASKVHVYAYDTQIADIASNYRKVQRLHVIRHAQGTHNVNQEYRNIQNLDAPLTPQGHAQCRAFQNTLEASNGHLRKQTQLVVSSPLTRCLQTTWGCLQPLWEARKDAPRPALLAHEDIRETVNYHCDRRRSIQELMSIAGSSPEALDKMLLESVDFSHTSLDDEIWEYYHQRLGCADTQYTTHRESAELHKVADRGRRFMEWLSFRHEEHIVMCSHAAFLRCLWNFGHHAEGVPKQPPQVLDERGPEATDVPVVAYQDEHVANYMQQDFDNCELRSVILAHV